jgi:hypothetical protein
MYLVVEEWKVVNGKYVSIDATEWHFGPMFSWSAPSSSLVPVPGKVWMFPGGTLGAYPIRSTPCQDIRLKKMLLREKADPPAYHAIIYNYISFVREWDYYAVDVREVCCNPDGTIWKR